MLVDRDRQGGGKEPMGAVIGMGVWDSETSLKLDLYLTYKLIKKTKGATISGNSLF